MSYLRDGASRSKSGLRMYSGRTVVTALLVVVLGCAQSGLGEIIPETDSTEPDADGGVASLPRTPMPGPTDAGKSVSKDAGTDASGGSKDSGTVPGVDAQSGAPKPAQGEVLITEVMYDPSGNEPAAEWFEFHNAASSARTLSGLTIADGGNRTHVIRKGVTIDPGAYVVFVRSRSAATAAKVPSNTVVYEYGLGLPVGDGLQLANASTGSLWLRDGGTTIARADYGGWYSQSGGSSIQLDSLTWAASGQKSDWCLSTTEWSPGSDNGTPGAASDCQ